MLTLFDSNRYEALTEALLDALAESASDGSPWRALSIIAPSAAIQRRLELEIAARFGICANIQFSYLAQWLWKQIGQVMNLSASNAFVSERLVWRCYRLLKARAWAHMPRLSGWLRDADEAMRYALAQRIARLFDRYLLYRPDWLDAWQRGQSILNLERADAMHWDDEQWQMQLWRQLCAECAAPKDTAPGLFPFLSRAAALDAATIARAQWPERLHVFALPAIAPLHLALLREFARWIDIRLYTLNPCRQYWGDWVSAAQRADLALHDQAEVGNVLLTEWGQQTQTHLTQLQTLADTVETVEVSRPIENPASTWLAALQNAWLDGRALPKAPTVEAPACIEIHICHSLTRQLEVLHDRLLALFNANDADTAPPSPSDALVVIPNLAAAAPLIDAVFGATRGARRIPYRITGLPAARAHPAIHMLRCLLSLLDQRITWANLMEWLRIDGIAVRYGLEECALEAIERWCSAAGALHSEIEATPCQPLKKALMRLYLGYALPEGAAPVAGVLPASAVVNPEVLEWLGRLSCLIDNLDNVAQLCAQAAPAAEWQTRLLGALEHFFPAHAQDAEAMIEVRAALNRLFEAMQEGAADALLPAAVVRSALMLALEEPARGGVPTGGVTFCAPASLRGLPYRVVCLLGMDDGALPGRHHPDEFDLSAALPRAGDRQRRQEERNLFLDLILAARERLLIAYTGRHLRDNAPLPPAAPVDELLDHLGEALASASGHRSRTAIANARKRFIVEHPLHPFSAEYFSNAEPRSSKSSHLFTYNPDCAEIAAALNVRPARASAPLLSRPLPPLENGNDPVIEFSAFERFWRHPARALLCERLGIRLAKTPCEFLDLEPFTLDPACRRALANRVLPLLLAGDAHARAKCSSAAFNACAERARSIARASPELPNGALGAALCASEFEALTDLAARIRSAGWQSPTPRLFTLELTPAWPAALAQPECNAVRAQTPIQIAGLLQTAAHDRLILYRYAPAGARDYLSAWLCHLVMCARAGAKEAPRTIWLGHPDEFAFKPVQRGRARAHLAELAALYGFGQCAPLRFFPISAWALDHQGEAAARRAWNGDVKKKGEANDAWLRIALRGERLSAALDAHFSALARTVLTPLIEYLEVIS